PHEAPRSFLQLDGASAPPPLFLERNAPMSHRASKKASHNRRERILALAVIACVFAIPLAAVAQAVTTFGSASGVGCPGGNVICNGSINFLTTELFFEPETPFASLKGGPPTFNETEQLLDNPYAVVTGCTDANGPLPVNDQGFPTYCTNGTFIRRTTFGVYL